MPFSISAELINFLRLSQKALLYGQVSEYPEFDQRLLDAVHKNQRSIKKTYLKQSCPYIKNDMFEVPILSSVEY